MKRTIMLLLISTALLALISCGGPPATPTPPPDEIARQAGTKMLATDSFHFTIKLSGKSSYLDDPPTMALRQTEGDLVKPDQVRAIVKVSTMGITSEVGIIKLADEQYVTNPLTQKWEQVPPDYGWAMDPSLFYDPNYGIEAILQGTTWTLASGEGGTDTTYYVLRSRMLGDQLRALTFGMISSGEVTVDFWVGRQDSYIHRIQIVELESDASNPTTWLIELSAFDQPMEITAPPMP